jgi:hypothetical protein
VRYMLVGRRSNELKRRVESLTVVPPEFKIREWQEVDVSVRVEPRPDDGALDVTVVVSKLGKELVREALSAPLERAQKRDTLAEDLGDLLGTFGDHGIRAKAVEVVGAGGGYFVPRSMLKQLKNQVAERLPTALETSLRETREAARAALREEANKGRLVPEEWGARRFAIKVRGKYERSLNEKGNR